jgi:SAM-dependent methyltransferase
MVLHHLPTRQHLDACFRQITRVLKPGGAIYLTDFGRLKSLKSVLFFAYMNAEYQPHLFSLDYERSLRAAFLLEDFQVASANSLPSAVRVFSAFQAPLLVTMKTAKPLPAALLSRLQVLRAALPRSYRKDLDELRYFVKLGGYDSDPFSNAKG